jgi:membrane peptidoglycan carboxypeptidase
LVWATGAAALLVVTFIAYCAFTLPVSGGSAAEPGPAILFTAADGEVSAARGSPKGDRVAIDQLPADLIHAVVAIEDRRFYSHHGIDLHAVLRAAWRICAVPAGSKGPAQSPSSLCG